MAAFTRWLADATEMAAKTGPAQGTKTRPRLRPSTKPPPERGVPGRAQPAERPFHPVPDRRHDQAQGQDQQQRDPEPVQEVLRQAEGLRMALPSRTVRLKLTTRPAIIRTGRRQLAPVDPPATTTGRTGTMHGEMPVIRPPRKATTSNSAIGALICLDRRCSVSYSGRALVDVEPLLIMKPYAS